jgi:hypothetical protein
VKRRRKRGGRGGLGSSDWSHGREAGQYLQNVESILDNVRREPSCRARAQILQSASMALGEAAASLRHATPLAKKNLRPIFESHRQRLAALQIDLQTRCF